MLTRGTKIGRPKCLLIRRIADEPFTFPLRKVPRFVDKTDRECCRELSLLDDSSLEQSARGREEPESFRNVPDWHFWPFLMSLLFEQNKNAEGNYVRNPVLGGYREYFHFSFLTFGPSIYVFILFFHTYMELHFCCL